MNKVNFEENIKKLGNLVRNVDSTLSFTILEIGALPIEGQQEPFHHLLDIFPDSQILAFEVDKNLCEELNGKAKPGITFHPAALGSNEERRKFYETNHPMCCSLYKPNEKLLKLYNNLEVAQLKSTETMETVSLDYFTNQNNITSVDFIKIDIQGAELDVFRGGIKTIKDLVAIVSEVEFIPLYENQPLFGDVCSFLAENELMFHKFLGLAGRTLKPLVMNNNPNYPGQHMWSDAVFIKDINKLPSLSLHKLLKLGIIAFIYGSPDVTFQCFKYYDQMNSTNLNSTFFGMGQA